MYLLHYFSFFFPILLWSKVPQDEQQVVKPMSRNPILQFCELVARQQLSFVDRRVGKNAHKTGKKIEMMGWRHKTKRGPACLCSVVCDRFEGSHHMCSIGSIIFRLLCLK